MVLTPLRLSVKTTALENLDTLEQIIQYRFRDSSLLAQAMTHRSWAHEQVSPRAQKDARNLHNEALEFLGDSVLGLIVADYLFRAYPHASEGELSMRLAALVRRETCAEVAKELLATLNKIKLPKKGSKRSALKSAFMALWTNSEISSLSERLAGFRQELMVQLLLSLR